MRCPRCGTENPAGVASCSACGARLSPPPPPAAPVRKKRPVWLIVAAVLGTLFLLAVICAVAGALFFLPVREEIQQVDMKETSERAGDGYSTPEKALDAEAKNLLSGDWVFYTVDETDEYVEYWIGPKNAQFVKGVIVTKLDSGKWVASDVYTLDLSQQAADTPGDGGAQDRAEEDSGDDTGASEGEPTVEEVAVWVVSEYLTAVGEGRGDDAYDLTMAPLADAGPDAMVGDFESFEITFSETQPDGSVVVYFTLQWPDESSDMGALVVSDTDGVLWLADVYEMNGE